MIGVWDDLPVHQTPDPVSVPASSDPAAYERYYFGFCDVDGTCAVGLVLMVHPNKGILDAAFSVSRGGRHASLFAKAARGDDPADLRCGPVRLTLTEPMRSLRIRVDGEGFAADLTFRATTPAVAEDRVTRRRSGRVVQDRTRYVQLGRLRGTLTSPLGEVAVTEDTWFAGRDHSWGIWDAPMDHAGERGADDDVDLRPSFFWLIGTFDDWAVQAVTHAEADGRRYGEYAAVAPTLAAGAEPAGPGARQQARPVVGFDTTFAPGTWHLSAATVTIGGPDPAGPDEAIALESLHAVLPRSVGYDHPTWVPGRVPGRVPEVLTHTLLLADEDPAERRNHRALQFVRMTRADGAVGWGVVDQCVAAAHGRPPA